MEKKVINVGIIGCGRIAQTRHIPEYASNENANIVGYFDFNEDRAKEIAKKFGGKVYASVDQMLADSNIDAVSVCVTNSAHASVSIKALNAGKNVLCEKPMATSLEESEAMVKAAEDNHKTLMIDQNQRFAKSHVYAKKLLKEGQIGKVLTFKSNFGHGGPETWSVDGGPNTWFFDKNKSKYGAIFDLGVHKIDLIQYLLESTVKDVTAKLATLDKKDSQGNLIGVDDNAISIYELENGALGTVTSSWTYYGEEDNSTIIYGTKGIMKIYDDPKYSIKVILKDGGEILYNIDQIQTNNNQTKSGVMDEFISSLVEDREPSSDSGSVINTMRAIFASIESSKTGKNIVINKNN
ncbi:Gfo/Idh/MocA family protein [Companilactobacillus halodurans]|uniref:Gfo/Idh/MocA family oxidoreductase n=1 Tax=Companilactobacillus halodurans TaxID=2584183 RepID=A0A5P0ZLP7_9LACO|nr:Gfo/Idh/MocA family oxidoreductase [Companilactobacillus halodurans]MQS75138.1 Gfo/Idh/MocA family oxidoreductase [Companilactobacillus halodurans]MQS97745.1 Gfo/Idh/MocA family oxidoreductase [Companilactobacillus halodurans]